MKRVVTMFFVALFLLFPVYLTEATSIKPVKNVIILIPDGTGISHMTLSRWYNGGAPLAMDEIICGLVRTYSSDAVIADSAPSGSSYATGYKSQTGNIAVMPEVATMYGLTPSDADPMYQPLATVLEGARLSGRSVGLVATCHFPHATPADFSAHHYSRSAMEYIVEQQVYGMPDVVFAGGYNYLLPEKRKDKEDLRQVLSTNGYSVLHTRTEMLSFNRSKVWGLFAPSALANDFDRPSEEPALHEMTQKAIELLSKNSKGFFLMVEGSKVDWSSHANDPVGVISEFLAFDKAVKIALDFAKKDGTTVVIVVPDHSNGGLSIGNSASNGTYDELPISAVIDPLKKATLTAEGVESLAYEKKISLIEAVTTYYGITDLTDEEKTAIQNTKPGSLPYIVGPMLSKRAYLGWTTHGHTGEEVFFGVYHPKGHRPTGVLQNTDIAHYMESLLGLNLRRLTQELYQPAENILRQKGADVTIDRSDEYNPVLVAKKGIHEYRFPANKNMFFIDGQVKTLRSVVVHNGKAFYIPKEASDLIQ